MITTICMWILGITSGLSLLAMFVCLFCFFALFDEDDVETARRYNQVALFAGGVFVAAFPIMILTLIIHLIIS